MLHSEWRPRQPAFSGGYTLHVQSADPFAEFREAVTRHFAPLAAEFGLTHATERVYGFEIHAEFSSASSRLVIAHEIGSGPWVYVGISTGGNEHQFGLHTLVEDVEGTSASLLDDVAALASLDAQLGELAKLTGRYAASLLKGDAGRVPTLRVLRASAERARNRQFIGTATGAAPLDHRPTLQELFRQADDAEFPADVRLASVHSAVWDHEYSPEEVGRFLKLATHDIQRIVDALDNVTDDSLDELRAMVGTRN